MRWRRLAFTVVCVGATFLTLAFLALPLIALFTHVPLGRLLGELDNPIVGDALRVTVETNAISLALIVLVGTPCAYLLATRRFPGRALALTLIELPLILPPAVAGIGLLAAFSNVGLLQGPLDALGLQLVFTRAAVVLAI